jgi:hypothetical protein
MNYAHALDALPWQCKLNVHSNNHIPLNQLNSVQFFCFGRSSVKVQLRKLDLEIILVGITYAPDADSRWRFVIMSSRFTSPKDPENQ